MKKIVFAAALALFFNAAQSQKLFTYGKYSVDAKEFLKAFEKNNSFVAATDRRKAMADYLEIYIRSKLKIREAYAKGYDTLPGIKAETENLRLQIIDNYMTDPNALDKLVKEAFRRSQKDIHAAHIFIAAPATNGVTDFAVADKKRDEVLKRLNAGEDFLKLAAEVSDDPSAKTNSGDLGYITVFTLPYFFENIIYSTPAGKHSGAYRSKSGYHIFKNLSERPAIGKLKTQQILLAFPPGTTEADKLALKIKIDSFYKVVKAGGDFSVLASQYSNDYVSASAGGNIPAFGIGQYEPEFEKAAFDLKKDGDISQPFATSHGYHILKRIEAVPVSKDSTDEKVLKDLKALVNQPERTSASQKQLLEKIKKQAGYKEFPYKQNVLKAYTDSIAGGSPIGIGVQQDKMAPLFKIGDSTFRVPDWIGYVQVFRYDNQGRLKAFDVLMNEFTEANVMQYYRENLEKYNADFRIQMNEFKDGNLFFEIMQREIWNTAQTDEAALKKYFEANKTKYKWKPSADAVTFYCNDMTTAEALRKKIQDNPIAWQTTIAEFEERVSADSSRNELENIPSATKLTNENNVVTTPLVNPNDKSASFAWVIKHYNTTEPRSFEDAKGLVINDYQNMLDEKWIAQLKKKYPVVINQPVFKTLK
jgi:peptidyl-prolyl cis-trans isomerase SurA